MTAVTEGMRDLLTTHVGTSGWTLNTGDLPTTPHKVIAFMDTGGPPANPRYLLDYPTVQVLVRGAVGSYVATFNEAKAVKDILLGLPSQLINGDQWVAVNLGSDVRFLEFDENERPVFSINFRLIVEPATNADTNRVAI